MDSPGYLNPFWNPVAGVTLQKLLPANWECCPNVCNISKAMVIAGTI